MPLVRRFEFDVSFDRPQDAARMKPSAPEPAPPPREPEPEPEPPPPPEPTYSQAELDEAYERGMAIGRQAGEIDALERIEHRVADAVEQIGRGLKDVSQAQAGMRETVEREAVELAMLALRKLFPLLMERAEAAELEAVFTEAFEQAIEEPRILVRAPPSLLDALDQRIRDVAARAGFEGKLSLVADPRMAETACRVEWSEGGVERDPEKSIRAIEAAMLRGIAEYDRRTGAAAESPVEENAL